MLSYVMDKLDEIEGSRDVQTRDQAFAMLRSLGLDDFGDVLLASPLPSHRKLSRLLPAMASNEVQKAWTGRHGSDLLRQTSNFVRALSSNYTLLTGKALHDAQILDYGCGYGRVARLMYFYTDIDRVWGVDPWDRSIEECRKASLGGQFILSDYLPSELPVEGRRFDLVYAFSVFTHLSMRAAKTALAAIRKHVAADGVLCITIRPREYWSLPYLNLGGVERELRQHDDIGFAFRPHVRAPVDGDVTYGDTSITEDWLAANIPGWKVAAFDRSIEDSYQRYVFLRPT